MYTTANEIRANLSDCGMAFVYEPIKSDDKVLRTNAPVLVIRDIDRFVATIPNATKLILDMLDGSSLRVKVQAVVRTTLNRNVTAKNDDIELDVIHRVILGNAAPRTVPVRTVEKPVFKAMDGTVYDTALEARQANIAHLVTNFGMSLEDAQAATANMI